MQVRIDYFKAQVVLFQESLRVSLFVFRKALQIIVEKLPNCWMTFEGNTFGRKRPSKSQHISCVINS